MKTRTYIMIVVMSLVCFAAGCSTTGNINTPTGLQTNDMEPFTGDIRTQTSLQADDKEPFIGEIRSAARKRSAKQDNWYFWGDAARSSAAQYVWREQYSAPMRSKDQSEPVGIIELKF